MHASLPVEGSKQSRQPVLEVFHRCLNPHSPGQRAVGWEQKQPRRSSPFFYRLEPLHGQYRDYIFARCGVQSPDFAVPLLRLADCLKRYCEEGLACVRCIAFNACEEKRVGVFKALNLLARVQEAVFVFVFFFFAVLHGRVLLGHRLLRAFRLRKVVGLVDQQPQLFRLLLLLLLRCLCDGPYSLHALCRLQLFVTGLQPSAYGLLRSRQSRNLNALLTRAEAQPVQLRNLFADGVLAEVAFARRVVLVVDLEPTEELLERRVLEQGRPLHVAESLARLGELQPSEQVFELLVV